MGAVHDAYRMGKLKKDEWRGTYFAATFARICSFVLLHWRFWSRRLHHRRHDVAIIDQRAHTWTRRKGSWMRWGAVGQQSSMVLVVRIEDDTDHFPPSPKPQGLFRYSNTPPRRSKQHCSRPCRFLSFKGKGQVQRERQANV